MITPLIINTSIYNNQSTCCLYVITFTDKFFVNNTMLYDQHTIYIVICVCL